MRKAIVSILCIILCLASLCACGSKEKIEMIEVDGTQYETVYLYSFKDAEIPSEYSDKYTTTGFVYSNDKLNKGDTIFVWAGGIFEYLDIYRYGASAVVDEVVEVYHPKVKDNGDTFIITRFNYSTKTSSDLPEVKEYRFEVVKDRVIIHYCTD